MFKFIIGFLLAFTLVSAEATTMSKSFTATGVGNSISVKPGNSYTYSVSGTFVGTVVLEKTNNLQSWTPILSATGSASGTLLGSNVGDGLVNFRFRCSAYTSGTIVTALSDATTANLIQEFKSQAGDQVVKITDDGLTVTGNLSVSGTSGSTGLASFADGTAALPNSFAADTDTGFYRETTNTFGIAGNGATLALFSPTVFSLSTALQVKAGAGTAGTPTYSFTADPDTGAYSVGANSYGIAAGGGLIASFDTTGVIVNSGQLFTLAGTSAAPGVAFSAEAGLGFSRDAAGSMKLSSANTTATRFYIDTANGNNADAYVYLSTKSGGTGDSWIGFTEAGVDATGWIVGRDDSASANFVISQDGSHPGTNNKLVIATGATSGVQLVGTGTNDSASSTFVGEVASASRLKSAATSATSTTSLNVTAAALSLTAGDWDVSGTICFLPAGTTSVTLLKAAISKTTATLPATDTIGVATSGESATQFSTAANVMGANDFCLALPVTRESLTATTNIFPVANATFTVSTLTVYGSLTARRVR